MKFINVKSKVENLPNILLLFTFDMIMEIES